MHQLWFISRRVRDTTRLLMLSFFMHFTVVIIVLDVSRPRAPFLDHNSYTKPARSMQLKGQTHTLQLRKEGRLHVNLSLFVLDLL